jgi:hypothetical protein
MIGYFCLLNENLTHFGKKLVTLSNIKKRLIKTLASIRHHSLKKLMLKTSEI